jgi:hypothetical protein
VNHIEFDEFEWYPPGTSDEDDDGTRP